MRLYVISHYFTFTIFVMVNFPMKKTYRQIRRISNYAANNINATFSKDWDVDQHRDEHECEEHWQLRKAFMERWKNDYPEERLICLARVFANVEFMGCRYPAPVMQEIAQLSFEVGQQYRERKKTRLQRTFVSASDAAEDRAKGTKRVGGQIVDDNPKSTKIAFVRQGETALDDDNQQNEHKNHNSDQEGPNNDDIVNQNVVEEQINTSIEKKPSDNTDAVDYISEMMKIDCLPVHFFRETMFQTSFGRMVLLIRPWARKLWNIQTSCQVCGVNLTNTYEDKSFKLSINGNLLALGIGETKVEARTAAENLAWERIRREVISVVIKEQFIAQGDARISVHDVSGKSRREDEFGTPVENTVAMKMMKMMGWKGGGLGADAQGIAEPIKPNLQMVNRAGLGSAMGARDLRRAAQNLMQRYIASNTFDLDLVFSSDFAKDERALLHQCAQKIGLASRSYGEGDDRFLVVKKKLDPFSLVKAVIDKGGTTPKYQVFIPVAVKNSRQNNMY